MKNENENKRVGGEKLAHPIKRKYSGRGRSPLFGVKMNQREIRERYNRSITDAGGRILTLRLKNREACEALAFLVKDHGFRSESAAATWIIEDALLKIRSQLSLDSGAGFGAGSSPRKQLH